MHCWLLVVILAADTTLEHFTFTLLYTWSPNGLLVRSVRRCAERRQALKGNGNGWVLPTVIMVSVGCSCITHCFRWRPSLYTVWVKKNPPTPEVFWHFFPNGWEFLVQILHTYYLLFPICTRLQTFTQLSPTQTKLCHIKCRAPIDRPISRESSGDPNLVGDRAAHPVCDH